MGLSFKVVACITVVRRITRKMGISKVVMMVVRDSLMRGNYHPGQQNEHLTK